MQLEYDFVHNMLYCLNQFDGCQKGDMLYFANRNEVKELEIDRSSCGVLLRRYYFKPVIFKLKNQINNMPYGIFPNYDLAFAVHSALKEAYEEKRCPKNGSFIAYKQVEDLRHKKTKIAVLEIPEDAKRIATLQLEEICMSPPRFCFAYKCRANKVKVLRIESLDGEETYTKCARSKMNPTPDESSLYRVGKMTYADDFDPDPSHECSHGIHFFMKREDAVNY